MGHSALHSGERLCIAVLAMLGVTLAAIHLPGRTTILWQAFVGVFALFGGAWWRGWRCARPGGRCGCRPR